MELVGKKERERESEWIGQGQWPLIRAENPTAAVLPLNPAVVPLVRFVFESSPLDGTGGGTASGTSWYRTSASDGHFSGSGGGSSQR